MTARSDARNLSRSPFTTAPDRARHQKNLFFAMPRFQSILPLIAAAGLALTTTFTAATAQEAWQPPFDPDAPPVFHRSRSLLGHGALLSEDLLGDRKDRWRTGSAVVSYVWGPQWTGALPTRLGDLVELRLGVQAVSPADLENPAPGDRPYAGSLSIGLHTHADVRGYQLSLGADLVAIGPDTGVDSLQSGLHDILGSTDPENAIKRQLGNRLNPTFIGEIAREYRVGSSARLRPFAEARAGDETLLRVGADLTIGTAGLGELLVRDSVSGHRYRAIRSPVAPIGVSFVVGGDIAYVDNSIYLPESRGVFPEPYRGRLRAGVHVQQNSWAGFYGLTYLSREFTAQPEGQVIGTVQLRIRF